MLLYWILKPKNWLLLLSNCRPSIQLSWQKRSPEPFAFAWGRDIVDQHMMDMEQGAGSIDGEGKVVDDGIQLHHTMVWLRFFCGWMKKYQFLPRPTGQREHGSEYNHEKRPQLLIAALQDNAIAQKIAGKFPIHVLGRLCDSPVLAAAGVMGVGRTIIH